ncbi:MAG: isoprenylcysteine carboxylmethyltransferase family protein [Nibricoccus sp.]
MQLTPSFVYAAHAVFWISFVATRLAVRSTNESPPEATVATTTNTMRGARSLVAAHGFAFAILYAGIFNGVWHRLRPLFESRPMLGISLILAGTAFAVWSLFHFRSWRFQAKLEIGHQLATTGPFAIVRHPIYASLTLLGVGSALWIPNSLTVIGCVLVALVGDLRGRAEERLLAHVFKKAYVDYKSKVARLIPKIY